MNRQFGALTGLVTAVTLAVACGGGSQGSGFANDDGGGGGGSGGGSGSGGGGGSGGGSGGNLVGDGSTSGSDGATGACVPNPSNYDIPGNKCDDDGDGQVDNVAVCDKSLTASGSAHDFANALGLCQDVAGQKWGIVSAAFTQGYNDSSSPNADQHGILPKFGSVIVPREGGALGVLSSGYGREWDNASGSGSGSCSIKGKDADCFKGEKTPMSGKGTAPPGYPKAAAGCPSLGGIVMDAIGVTLQVKVPANAKGFTFDFDFYSGEWPEYVCTPYNDSFVAWLQSGAFMGTGGDLNISYDAKNNPVSVNNGFFDRCTMNASVGCCRKGGSSPEGCSSTATGTAACAGGPMELGGTGFEDDGTYCVSASTGGGATGWLTTSAPAKPGEVITLQFIIWDTGDWNFDSSVLLDNFKWLPGPTTTGTMRPPMAQ